MVYFKDLPLVMMSDSTNVICYIVLIVIHANMTINFVTRFHHWRSLLIMALILLKNLCLLHLESCYIVLRDPGCLDLANICGFILNVPSDYKFGFVMLPLRRRHWVAIRQIQGNFYNLDSKLDTPQLIGRVRKSQLECFYGTEFTFSECIYFVCLFL